MQDESKAPSRRGGPRPGSGRKPSVNPRNHTVTLSLTALADKKLRKAAETQGLSRNEFMNALLEDLPYEVD